MGTIDSCTWFGCQVALLPTLTDCLHSFPGAPRALPLWPVLNGCQQEEKVTKDRRPDFGGGVGKGFLWIADHIAWTPGSHLIPEEEEEAEQTSFE